MIPTYRHLTVGSTTLTYGRAGGWGLGVIPLDTLVLFHVGPWYLLVDTQ